MDHQLLALVEAEQLGEQQHRRQRHQCGRVHPVSAGEHHNQQRARGAELVCERQQSAEECVAPPDGAQLLAGAFA